MEYNEFRDRRRGCNGIQNIGIMLLMAGLGIACIPMFVAGLTVNTVYFCFGIGGAVILLGGLVMWRGRVARDRLQWDVEQGQRVYSYGGEPRFNRYGSHRPHKHELESNDDCDDDEETVVQSRNRQREELQGAFGFCAPNLRM